AAGQPPHAAGAGQRAQADEVRRLGGGRRMRFLIRLLGALWFATLVVSVGFAWYEVHEERSRLVEDLQRRASLTAAAVLVDAEPLEASEWDLWRRTAVRMGVLMLLVTGITWLTVRWSVTRPMERIAEWTRQLKSGQPVAPPPEADAGLFGSLATEVT